jgi:hypothetical protein
MGVGREEHQRRKRVREGTERVPSDGQKVELQTNESEPGIYHQTNSFSGITGELPSLMPNTNN